MQISLLKKLGSHIVCSLTKFADQYKYREVIGEITPPRFCDEEIPTIVALDEDEKEKLLQWPPFQSRDCIIFKDELFGNNLMRIREEYKRKKKYLVIDCRFLIELRDEQRSIDYDE